MNEAATKQFSHIKIHSQYSICEGAIKIKDLPTICKKNKIKTLGLCDSYNLCGALEFSESVSNIGTQPIIGTQINIKDKDRDLGKISLFAKSLQGYKNLIKLSSKSFMEIKKEDTPHCTLLDIKKNSDGIILLTGSIDGFFGKLYLKNLTDEISDILIKLKKSFKNDIYLEIQRHNDENERQYEKFILNLSKTLDLPIIATHEVFYLNKDMHEAHDAYLCIGEKTYVNSPNRKRYSNEHYLKTSEEMCKLFSDLPEALENNFNFPFKISYKPSRSLPTLPNVQNNNFNNPDEQLSDLAKQGLKEKLKEYVYPSSSEDNKKIIGNAYLERLNHEIKIICKMKYSSYFIIVSDYIKWAKNNNIPVGPGRGSGAGSLVAWCLSITDIDPIKFDLIFERFLNPDRISMPDFDIDFCEEKRDRVFEYLKKKYGKGVAHIITFGKLKARMAFRDIGRVLGFPYGFVDSLCKMIPFDPSRPLSLEESVAREPRLQKERDNDQRVKKLIELSTKLEGLNRNMATHAAGVVIAEKNLAELIPLYKDFSSDLPLPTTQFDMYSSEDAGLVKFDLLGLKTLTVINKTISLLNKKNIKLDISKILLNDKKIFELLSTGETTGLFQLESSGMRETLKQMKPNKFEDIIALVALYRPGPMSNIGLYNQCKHGQKEPDYLHPKLKKILEPTYGIIIYQEQVMQIAQTLSGFTAGEADILRRAMGKKKRKELEEQRERFIKGAEKNNIAKDKAAFIYNKIAPFAEYGFNKSHATAYALIAYQTAYLKAYYPDEFLSASMSHELSNTDKLSEFFEDLKRLKIEVHPPCINNCFAEFIPKNKIIYYALGAIKSVGYEAISSIVDEREKNGKFKSLSDFINRVNPRFINKLQMEALVKSGAFDSIFKNRKKFFNSIPNIIKISKNIYENKIMSQESLFTDDSQKISYVIKDDNTDQWTNNEKLANEFSSIGFYISDHPINEFKDILQIYNTKSYKDFINNEVDQTYLAGTIMSIQEKKTSKGNSFAIVKFSDSSGVFELFIFSELLDQHRNNLIEGQSFLLTVIKDKKNQENRFKRISLRKIVNVNDLVNKNYKEVYIEIDKSENIKKLSETINEKGSSKIQIFINETNKQYLFELKDKRKFNFETLKNLNKEQYIKKIRV